MSMDYGLERGGSPTPRGPSNEDVRERAEELAAEWLRDPDNLMETAISGGATDCYIWTALLTALDLPVRTGYYDDDITIGACRYIRSILIKAAAPQFMEQARCEWRNRETNDD